MQEKAPQPISGPEHRARQNRVEAIAHRLGFVGTVEYRHVSTRSGGAQYGMGAAIEKDGLIVYPEAFRRDAAGDNFSLEAIIAHERGHQLLCRHQRLRRNTPKDMSAVIEEVLASLIGSLIVDDPGDGEVLRPCFPWWKAECQPRRPQGACKRFWITWRQSYDG